MSFSFEVDGRLSEEKVSRPLATSESQFRVLSVVYSKEPFTSPINLTDIANIIEQVVEQQKPKRSPAKFPILIFFFSQLSNGRL